MVMISMRPKQERRAFLSLKVKWLRGFLAMLKKLFYVDK